MKIIIYILKVFLKWRLSSLTYRREIYVKAYNHQLRDSKFGRLILKVLNELMVVNPKFHEEFKELTKDFGDYQKVFWESDLGFLWYQGNINADNHYFNFGINRIRGCDYKSVLDVGCGWGRFSYDVSKQNSITRSLGIDISPNLIKIANGLFSSSNLSYEFINFLSVTEAFDLITFWGSTDYIPGEEIKNYLSHAINLANKEVLVVNSLRNVPFEEVLNYKESKEIKRYDMGFIHPLNNIMIQINKERNDIEWKIIEFGLNSSLLQIIKIN